VHHNLEWLRKTPGAAARLQVTVGDVRDARLVERAVAHANEIYHFAAQVAVTTSVADPRLDFEVNLAGTFNVLDAARRSGNRPFILFTSTNKVYGELGLGTPVISGRIYGLPAVVFRMSCIAGPRQFGTEDQGWVAHFVYSALQEETVVIYGDGRQVRDVLCVDDLLRAVEAARLNIETTRTEVYNIGGGPQNSVSLLELMDEIESLTGRSMDRVLHERRPGDQLVYVTDNGKIQRDTGWKPEIGWKKTVRLLEEFWEENHGVLAKRRRAAGTAVAPFALATELSGRAG
jgi:CDP-paratose 2-epimerase